MEGRGHIATCLDDYTYDLPEALIAQFPSTTREASRLLVLDRSGGRLEHRRFDDVCLHLKSGDVLVVNDTRVVPARLCGVKETGGRVEILVLDPHTSPETGEREGYRCLLKSAKRLRLGGSILLEDGTPAKVLTSVEDGQAQVRFLTSEPLVAMLERIGRVPLPPYIRRDGIPAPVDDLSAYQTVYAAKHGAVAAPTAGLHFSNALLQALERQGVEVATVTLHVGYGTFAPIRTADIREHRMHAEHMEITPESAERIEKAGAEGRRIVAVGTTVVRALEWAALPSGRVAAFSGWCRHYITPGYRFRIVDAMITNFHLPKSTLLLLVSAFAGRERILEAYAEAVREEYRFFSYGDAMLIL